MALTRLVRTATRTGRGRSARTSTVGPATVAPATWLASWQKRATARATPSGSTPRSNRTDASVRKARRLDVRATAAGSIHAASMAKALGDVDHSRDDTP